MQANYDPNFSGITEEPNNGNLDLTDSSGQRDNDTPRSTLPE